MSDGRVTVQRSGVRTVELFIPYEFQGIKVEAVSIGPLTLDHTQRWKQGAFADWFALLTEMAVNATTGKPMRADDLRQLRYPDADRVIDNFGELLPVEIKQAMAGNFWPTRADLAPQELAGPAPVPGAAMGGTMQPDAGFDIGDD